MHIVHTESSQGWGGQEIRILSEARGMIARGHQVTLLTPRSARIHDEALRIGIPTVALPLEKKRLPGLLAMRAWLRQNPPDIINTHSSTDSWLAGLAKAAGGISAPIVRTRHISAPVKNSRANRWLYGKSACRVVTTGEALRCELLATLALPAQHVLSVPTGIDLSRFSRAQTLPRAQARQAIGVPEEALVVGIAATLRSWKGHDDLLAAFYELAARRPEVHLVIAGDGPQYARLREETLESPYADRIHMLGHREDVPNILASLDIFALPSFANEGVPQAIMQAMAMALPVVSTTIGAISDAVADNETGFLLPPRQPVRLCETLELLAVNHEMRAKLGEQGRQRAQRLFSSDSMLDAMTAVFVAAMQPGHR